MLGNQAAELTQVFLAELGKLDVRRLLWDDFAPGGVMQQRFYAELETAGFACCCWTEKTYHLTAKHLFFVCMQKKWYC